MPHGTLIATRSMAQRGQNMNSTMIRGSLTRRSLLRAACFVTGLAASIAVSVPARADSDKPRAVTITKPWARPSPPGLTVSALYFVVENKGDQADRLIGQSSPIASRADLHETRMEGGMARMRPVRSLTIPAKGRVKAEPGGLHMMLIGLTRPLTIGERIPVTLQFERAGIVTIEAVVANVAPK